MTKSTAWLGGSPARKSSARSIILRNDGNAASDGDTLAVEQALRLVSCDTPESHYPTAGSEKSATEKLTTCRDRLVSGKYDKLISPKLRDYLLKKLTKPEKAAAEQFKAAAAAHEAFERMLKKRLNAGGVKRKLGVLPTGEIIDGYGRMLAYLTPWFDSAKEEVPGREDRERRTFNLQMVEEGWAAPFMIFGSLPTKKADFDLALKAARTAWKKQAGVWKMFGKDFLLGYEFRICVKLGQPLSKETTAKKAVTLKMLAEAAFARHCVDISRPKWRLLGPHDFWLADPASRLWFWSADEKVARKALGV